VCPPCLAAFEPIGNSCCLVCGEPFPHPQEPHLCLRCTVKPKAHPWCRSLYLYRGATAHALSCLKYGKRLCILDPLISLLLTAATQLEPFPEPDLVVPVPASLRGLWKRGFNQSTVLADPLGKLMGIPVERSVLSRQGSKQQVGLGRSDRNRNAAVSFGPGRRIDLVNGKRVLLFDDVYTTGATVRACARILLRKEASVSVLTFARRSPEDIEHLIVDRSISGKHL
jgi:ComF family protein